MISFRCFTVLICFALTLPALRAQSVDQERARIENQRQQMQIKFDVQVTDCYEKFAVNRCLNQINVQHREQMADLRRQEILLNDGERKKRGAEQMRKVEEKLLETNRQQLTDQRGKMLAEYEQRSARRQQVVKSKEDPALSATQSPSASQSTDAQIKKGSSGSWSSPGVEKSEQYKARQSKAQERRMKHEAEVSKRSPSKVKSLPVPF